MGIIRTRQVLQHLHLLDETAADVRRQIEVESRDSLSAVHLILRRLERDTAEDARRLDTLGRTGFAMTGGEAVLQNLVQGMLDASQTLCRIVIFIVDMEVVVFDRVADILAQEIVIDEGLGRLAGEFHHHACRRVGVHVGVFARDVVRFDVDNLEEHVPRLGFAGDAALVAVGDVFLGNVLAAAVHQFQFDGILNVLYRHLRTALESDAVRDLADQLDILARWGMQHSFADSCGYLFFIKTDDASVSFYYCLNHLFVSF